MNLKQANVFIAGAHPIGASLFALKDWYCCNGKRGKGECTPHHIREEELYAIILDDLCRVTHFACKKERLEKLKSSAANVDAFIEKAKRYKLIDNTAQSGIKAIRLYRTYILSENVPMNTNRTYFVAHFVRKCATKYIAWQ